MKELTTKNYYKLPEIIKKLEFHAVGFGIDADKKVLQQMVDAFGPNGKMCSAPNPEALRESMLKLVPNIYQ